MTVKRFIAGAVCPRCEAMDKIVTYRVEEVSFRECVNCDYKDEMNDAAPKDLPTRVTPKVKVEPGVQPIKFFKAPKKK